MLLLNKASPFIFLVWSLAFCFFSTITKGRIHKKATRMLREKTLPSKNKAEMSKDNCLQAGKK